MDSVEQPCLIDILNTVWLECLLIENSTEISEESIRIGFEEDWH